ncbi:MAG: hypothetical protein ACI4TD_11870, partial [Phocaeicola sp.]
MKTFTHNVTRVKDPDTGVWNELPSISGKTAYQYALDGGYTGTEEEFKAKMAAEYLTAADLDPYAKTEALSVAITSKEIDEICTDVVDGSGSIPIATKSTIGCVAVGDGLDVDENGTVSLTPTEEVDFVVDQGTSDIWAYRKWNSGIAELWGRYDTTSTSVAGTGLTHCGATFPFTFVEKPFVTANFGLTGIPAVGIRYVESRTTSVD